MMLRAAPALALSIVSVSLEAQTVPPPVHYVVGGIEVTRWVESGVTKASWSVVGGDVHGLKSPDDRLHFRALAFDPVLGVPQFGGVLDAPAGTRLWLVQFHTQILGPYRDQVVQVGGEILHYMPANALFVRCDAATVPAIQALPFVRWVGALPNALKLDAALTGFVAAGGVGGPVDCDLVLAAKTDRARVGAQVAALQGVLLSRCDGSVMVRARLTAQQLLGLLAFDTVTWANLSGPDGVDMDNARVQGGANAVEALANLRGQGVRAEITEGFDETHGDLVGRVLVRGTNYAFAHGHCTAGIVGGNGAGDALSRGMMPDCDLIEGAYSSSNHYAQILDSVNPALPWHTMVATASWGAGLTVDYDAITAAIDDALFDSDLTRLNSQSNNGDQLSRPEAWAKNIISVGGLKHLDDALPGNDRWNQAGDSGAASIGPAADGRLKPDIAAYFEAVRTTDLPGSAGYTSGDYAFGFGGTSAATPIVAGHVGILQQMFTDGSFGNPLPQPATPGNRFANKPHMTTSKALLCNTAEQYPFAGATHDLTRTHQGWGFPSLERAWQNRERMVVLDEYDTLSLGDAREYWVQIGPGTPEFRATMVYADPAAQPNASIHLVNDLHLKVTRLGDGVFWWGNNGLAEGTTSTSGGLPNDRDTIECVYLANPLPGTYLVRVEAASIVQDAKVETPALDVDYSLVFHPVSGGFRCTTGLQFDLQSSGPGDLRMVVTNLPATGWTQGFTCLSFTTNRGLGFGRFFGVEIDGISGALWGTPIFVGNAFHFPNAPGSYPYVDYTLLPSIVSAFAGWQIDCALMLFDGPDVVAVSNVDRITLQ